MSASEVGAAGPLDRGADEGGDPGPRRRADDGYSSDHRVVMLLRLPGTYPAQGDTQLLAGTMERRGLAEGRRVLDLCTGTGALALAAARAGAREVVAVDLSRRVAFNARLNARLDELRDRRPGRARVEVRRGDLMAPVAGERFDLVLANPPYVPAPSEDLPRYSPGRSWDAGVDGRALLDRICTGVADVLAPGGTLLLTHSVLSDERTTLDQLRAAGLDAEVVERRQEPFGPVMRRRADLLRARGLLDPHQDHEELVVVEARAPSADVATPQQDARTDSAA